MSSTIEMRHEMARLYDRLPTHDPAALPAYEQFRTEVRAQYRLLHGAMAVKIVFTMDDPYRTSKEMFNDIDVNWRLKVFTGGEVHQTLGDDNFRFRAIHDYFGHYISRANFSANGEETAWENHSKMFSPLARRAMTSETRGQNSWFNYSPANSILKPKYRKFAEQKTALLPKWASELNS